jgi:predicted HAD superfamily Cof-like phosphohydrolase
MNNSLNQVKEFHNLFDQPVLAVPGIPDKARVELRLSLILEELTELAVAAGAKEVFATMMIAKATNLTADESDPKPDLVEVLDALCDLRYVCDGTTLEFGLNKCFDEGFNDVHGSNMSKLCDTLDQAEETQAKYNAQGIVTSMIFRDGKYSIVRTEDNKVLKNKYYRAANLAPIVEKQSLWNQIASDSQREALTACIRHDLQEDEEC